MIKLQKLINYIWYRPNYWYWLLLPMTLIYSLIINIRTLLFTLKILPTRRLDVPVIVVGNINVGGTGKTPLVLTLANYLQLQGYKVGIISRGYHGIATAPLLVKDNTDAMLVGDEPLLLARRTGCPVAVGKNRIEAGKLLLANHEIDVIISDDGLQHYYLGRDIEIIMLDSQRKFGNGALLPMGPLREPISRLPKADIVVVAESRNLNEFNHVVYTSSKNVFPMHYQALNVYNLREPHLQYPLEHFTKSEVHAVAGIANPDKFFTMLRKYGISVKAHAFPDHYKYSAKDFASFNEQTILVTEKDAVKIKNFASKDTWVVAINAELASNFYIEVNRLLQKRLNDARQ